MEKFIENQIDEKTKTDPVMNKFLKTIVENDCKSSQYKNAYDKAIEEALTEEKA